MEPKICKKCGVVLCEKNWSPKPDYMPGSCKACVSGYNRCYVVYPTERLNKLAIKNSDLIITKLWKLRNLEKVKQHQKRKYEKNIKVCKARSLNYYYSHKEQVRKDRCRYIKQQVMDMTDVYMRELLSHHIDLSTDTIPLWLIKMKRKQIKTFRKWQNAKQQLKV